MLRSKPIGWITAGTLSCVAAIALGLKLSNGSGPRAQASDPPPAEVAEAKTEKPEGPKVPPDPVPATAAPVPALPMVPEPPPLAAGWTEPTVPSAIPSPAPVAPTGVPFPAPPPVPGEPREPMTNLLSPTPVVPETPILPVAAKEKDTKPAVTTADFPGDPPAPEPPPTPVAPKSSPAVEPPPPPATLPAIPPRPSDPLPMPPAVTPIPYREMPRSPGLDRLPPPLPAEMPTCKVRGKGETLMDIARRTLGNEARWREIDRLNPHLRARSVIPGGEIVRLPVGAKTEGAIGSQGEEEHVESVVTGGAGSVRPLPVVRAKAGAVKKTQPMTGTYSCRINDARAVVIPAEALGQLGKVETMLLTPGPDRCLWLTTREGAAEVLRRVEKAEVGDAEYQTFRRLYYSQTVKAAVDESGKMVIPERLAEYAGLGKEVVLIGIDDHFELWDAARWRRYSRQNASTPKAVSADGEKE